MASGEMTRIPEPTTGGAGRLRHGGGAGSPAGTPEGDELDRLAAMLERIEKTLGSLTQLQPPIIDQVLAARFVKVWPEAQRHLNLAVRRLRRETNAGPVSYGYMILRLHRAGLMGAMLEMKDTSLRYHLDPLDETINVYVSQDKPILTYPERRSLVEKLVSLVSPASKVMNSILGSLPAVVMPGKEMVKEYKEHVEASYEAISGSRE
jgi:hypothetical protein